MRIKNLEIQSFDKHYEIDAKSHQNHNFTNLFKLFKMAKKVTLSGDQI